MIIEFQQDVAEGFEWVDVFSPSKEELAAIAEKYELHPALVKDCLQPDHLPKYEKMDNYSFIIFRVHDESGVNDAHTVQELTHKLAVFYSPTFVITIHRSQQPLINKLMERGKEKPYKTSMLLVNTIILTSLNTYLQPLNKLSDEIDYYESVIFLRPKRVPLLKGLYHFKRKIDLITRMIELSDEIVAAVDAKVSRTQARETRDLYIKLKSHSSYLSENTLHLLNIYFSATSQRTNETMRVLTIFSVFFMPLTFIVGVYGMNFDYMPELKWLYGYPAVIIVMLAITIIIYIWFKRKKWL